MTSARRVSATRPTRTAAPHAARLSAADLERLRAACGRQRIEPTRSLFGPRSVTWRVNREAILLLGGGRALLLQVAHPLVAAGVAEHSNFRTEPLTRLRRTLELMLTITFADAAHAIHAVRQIERVHSHVHGKLAVAAGPFRRGTRYHANDPALLFWVLATLIDTALLMYERFVTPLTPEERAAYFREAKIAARLFGIPEALIPRGEKEFRAYMRDMIEGDTLAVSAASRDIAASILRPPLPPGLQHAVRATNFVTTGLLPAKLRERYGLHLGIAGQAMLGAMTVVAPLALALVPLSLRSRPARLLSGERRASS